jgi:mono/diheme cytochrome c family protein
VRACRRLPLRLPLGFLLATVFLVGCDDMTNQPKQKAYTPLVGPAKTPGATVLYEDRRVDPPPLTMALLERGQERFRIYCTPCHSELGDGHGMIVQRGFPPPPSYHIDRLRTAPVGHFYDVITNGYGAMYSFADRVQPQDRWAIASYIRALQKSQHATAADLPPDRRSALQ